MDGLTTYHLHKEQPEKLQFEIHDLNSYLAKNSGHTSIPHAHTFHQILWFFKGKGEHFVDFTSYNVVDNSVFFIAKDQIHFFDESQDSEGVLIHFNEHFLSHTEIDFFLKFNLFNNSKRSQLILDMETKEHAVAVVNMMKSESNNSKSYGYKQVIRYFLKALLVMFERLSGDSSNQMNDAISNRKQIDYWKFKELVEINFRTGLSVQEYADQLNMSTKTLGGVTKVFCGLTPLEVVSQRTLLEAKRLLAFSTYQINEIAFDLGFEDDSYFIKFFKKYLKMTPSAYRDEANS